MLVMRPIQPHPQSGAITLMVAITLVLIAGLSAYFGAQSVFIDRLAGHAQIQATHARLAAEAALAWAQADLQRSSAQGGATALWAALPKVPCPSERSARQWQCVQMPNPVLPAAQGASAEVLLIRDVLAAPHVVEVRATSTVAEPRSQAQVQQSLYMPTVLPVPASASSTAVVLSAAVPGSACSPSAWSQVLGDLSAEHIRAWSLAQEQQGLHALSQPPRSIYWVDSPAPWTQSVGSAQSPVLLVFSAAACTPSCPQISTGARIHGTVVLDTQCQETQVKGWPAGQIHGQLLINSAWPGAPTPSPVTAQPYARNAYKLLWPTGIDARQVQLISGSWSEGSP